MALNWLMLSSRGQPVPLPDEKLYLTIPTVQLSMQPMLDSATVDKTAKVISASGTAYVTSQRVMFVAITHAHGIPEGLRTLSVPLSHWQDGRLAQPLFSAIYYEAHVRPVADGGLTATQLIKLSFNEGRSYEFVQAMDEVKARYEEMRGAAQRQALGEDLPTYTPSSGTTSTPRYSLVQSASPTPQPLDPTLLAAAQVARNAEDRERLTPSRGAPSEMPPGYEEVSPT